VWYHNWHVLIDVLHEIGFAALIALLILNLVERVSKLEQSRSADALLLRVSQNVLEASYGIGMKTEIVRHVIRHILAVPVIRTQMRQTFVLENVSLEDKNLTDYIILKVTSSYKLLNVSGGTVQWPIQVILPKTKYANLNTFAIVMACAIADTAMNKDQIQAAC
jgi:hypothetical protein